jgi:hypothetical protein
MRHILPRVGEFVLTDRRLLPDPGVTHDVGLGGSVAMAYIPSSNGRGMARLRSVALLEKAMKARDINGRELARTALTSAQTVSQLRTGGRLRVRADIARRLEQALRVRRGLIFSVGLDQQPGPADSATGLVAQGHGPCGDSSCRRGCPRPDREPTSSRT